MKTLKCAVLLAVVVVCLGGAGVLLTPSASAANSCWKVDCNTCCRAPGGGVICTQRACV